MMTGEEDHGILRLVQNRHIGVICMDLYEVKCLLKRIHVAVADGGGEQLPACLAAIFSQIETVTVMFLEKPHAALFLRKILRSFPQFDYIFAAMIRELEEYADVVEICCHPQKYLLLTDLLDQTCGRANHSLYKDTRVCETDSLSFQGREEWCLRALQDAIMKEQNLEKMFSSQMGGIYIVHRILLQRQDMHPFVASWLNSWPKHKLSAMLVDCNVALMLISPHLPQVQALAMSLCERKPWIHGKLLFDARFAKLKTALLSMGRQFACRINKEMKKYPDLDTYNAWEGHNNTQTPFGMLHWEDASSSISLSDDDGSEEAERQVSTQEMAFWQGFRYQCSAWHFSEQWNGCRDDHSLTCQRDSLPKENGWDISDISGFFPPFSEMPDVPIWIDAKYDNQSFYDSITESPAMPDRMVSMAGLNQPAYVEKVH